MFQLESGQSNLWQWNTNQRIIVDDTTITLISVGTTGTDVVRREVYEDKGKRYADIPNKLLQTAGNLYVYAHRMDENSLTTMQGSVFFIRSQPKPPDYIDDEQEVLIWHQLDERITRIEQQGSGGTIPYSIGNGLKLVTDGVNKTLMVDAADSVEQDNTLPITSAAVYTAVGNIDALLSTI